MSQDTLAELIEFLEERSLQVKRLEEEGEAILQTGGQLDFQAKLEEKAELLGSLGEDAWKLTEKVGGELGKEIAQKLEQFSMSANTSLRIGSVFFMTALLYPEDHTPGEPNELDVFIEVLKEKA